MRVRSIAVASTLIALALPTSAAAETGSGIDRFTPDKSTGTSKYVPASAKADAKVTVIVELKKDPVAVVQAKKGRVLSAAEKAAVRKAIQADQSKVKAAVSAKGGKVLSQMQSAYNGMRVTIARSKLASLAANPRVGAIRTAPIRTIDNTVSHQYLGVPAVWQNTGYLGETVKVAVIDTGIDYTHADFAGPGTTAAYNAAHAAETGAANPAYFGSSAPRIKGGWDFVGDGYDANVAGSVPKPDANPLDCNGHGTHVAGTIGGNGVKADGTTYTGAYDAHTYDTDFKIGPGVAPKADLYAYKVFGCEGSTDVVVEAIDKAVADGMQVINMSLGSGYGQTGDPDAVAATNAVAAGVVVVASAGNSGPNPYLVGSPSTGRGVISVAANDSTASFLGAELTFGTTKMAAINANGFTPLPSGDFKIVALADDPATAENEALGCSTAAYAKAGITTAAGDPKVVAVVSRGTCARVAKAVYGQQAGADAVIMINNAASYPPFEGQITSNPDNGAAYTVTIPFLGVRYTDGAALKAANGTALTMVEKALDNPDFTGPASFTSGGPRTGDSGAKPNLTAPGVSIVSAGVGTGNGTETLSGTSMAAPQVAGVAALTVQAHPGWSAGELSSALVSTANPSDLLNYRQTQSGTGLVNLAGAVGTRVFANGDPYNADGAAQLDYALNYGFYESTGAFSGTKTVTLTNKGTSAITYAVSVVKTSQTRPSTVTPSATSVTVPAGGTATVDVALSVPMTTVGSSEATSGGQAKFYEVSGSVTFTANGSTLRVPYLLVPRANSNVAVSSAKVGATSAAITLANAAGARTGAADFYSWGLTDAADTSAAAPGLDLRAAGVQSFKIGTTGSDQLLVFAVNNWTKFNNAASLEWDVAIDKNNDGKPDAYVFAADQGLVTSGDLNGVLGAFIYDPKTKATTSTGYLPVSPTDSSTVLIPVVASELLKGGQSGPFRYTVSSYDPINNSGEDMFTTWATYNSGNKAVNDGGYATVGVGASASVEVGYSAAQLKTQGGLGAMIVVFDNKSGKDEALLVPFK